MTNITAMSSSILSFLLLVFVSMTSTQTSKFTHAWGGNDVSNIFSRHAMRTSFSTTQNFAQSGWKNNIDQTETGSTTALFMGRKANKQGGGKASLKKKNFDQNTSQTKEWIDFIEKIPTGPSVDASDVPPGPPSNDDLAPFIRTIVKAADERKADNIRAIRVSKLTAVTCFIIVLSGNSRPQNQAIAASILDDVEEFHDGRKPRNDGKPEGTADSGWILVDYGDVMVHIMTPKSRLFYDLEGQWKSGEEMDLSDVLIANAPPMFDGIGSDGNKQMLDLSEEDDPFWS
eukprot:CAMPEP_0171321928 /NCGR_PEP_ID=MMETSP0816-20121228/114653_1 /TAXON_ID=420281 /ORGANISM="Proboscia inermis, Strain CCAP1064/1" /LENGTH=286 /DNA_ID=CAMNT_0011820299 /DNA_START=415 /DNA_END=1275 /DNA_ORIENTATION=-